MVDPVPVSLSVTVIELLITHPGKQTDSGNRANGQTGIFLVCWYRGDMRGL